MRGYLKAHADACPDVVVVSGDLTTASEPKGIDAARRFLENVLEVTKVPAGRLVVVPGNHDVDRSAFDVDGPSERMLMAFESSLYSLGCVTPYSPARFLDYRGVYIRPLDSCGFCGVPDYLRLEQVGQCLESLEIGDSERASALATLNQKFLNDAGMVDAAHLESMEHDMAGMPPAGPEGSVRIAVLHHHLTAFPLPELKHFEVVVNAGYVKRKLMQCGFDMVLHGHKHYGHMLFEQDISVDSLKGLLFVAAPQLIPSAGSARFVVIEVEPRPARRKVVVFLASCRTEGSRTLESSELASLPLGVSVTASRDVFKDEPSIDHELYERALDVERLDILAVRGRWLLTHDERWFVRSFLKRSKRPRIRVLLLNVEVTDGPIAGFLTDRAGAQRVSVTEFVAEEHYTHKRLQSMAYDEALFGSACFKAALRVRLYEDVPLWRIFRLDDCMYLNALTDLRRGHLTRAKHLSGYRVRAGGPEASLFQSFEEYFERVWAASAERPVDLLRMHYMSDPMFFSAFSLLNEFNVPLDIQRHCLRTAERAIFVADSIARRSPETLIRRRELEFAALVHDLARAMPESVRNVGSGTIDCHAIVASDLLKARGHLVPAEFVLAHSLAGIASHEAKAIGLPQCDGLMQTSLESKILSVADKMEAERDTPEKVVQGFDTSPFKQENYYRHCAGLREQTRKRFQSMFSELEGLGVDFKAYAAFLRWQQEDSRPGTPPTPAGAGTLATEAAVVSA